MTRVSCYPLFGVNALMSSGAFPWKVAGRVKKGKYYSAIVPGHPKAIKHGYVLEHRIIVELHLQRYLLPHEVVHHKNRDGHDNRIENLDLLSAQHHAKTHAAQQGRRFADCVCPQCQARFVRPYNSLQGRRKKKWLCCSRSCHGKMSRYVQIHGLTEEVQTAISGNIVRIFKRITDNPEETITLGSVETIRSPAETAEEIVQPTTVEGTNWA